jgi:hypothetical protein
MRFPISLAVFGLLFATAIGAVSVAQNPASQANLNQSDAAVAYRGSGRIQW